MRFSRPTTQRKSGSVGGTGAGALDTSNAFNPDGQISLSYEFDGNSRLVGIVDDNGNRTRNVYDALDRRVTHIYAIDDLDSGGTRRERFDYTYDRDDNVRTVTDPNGTVITKSHDVLNRLTATAIARAAGVGCRPLGERRGGEVLGHHRGRAFDQAPDGRGPAGAERRVGRQVEREGDPPLAQPAGDKDACLAYLRSRVEDLRQTHGQGRRGGKSKKARR